MNILIVKLNATGDVVRTTTLLRRLEGDVTWITAETNAVLLTGTTPAVRCLTWNDRERALDRRYDLVISLEDEEEVARFVKQVECHRIFGAMLDAQGAMTYSSDSSAWFDLSLISRFGRTMADELKLRNRQTYQDLVFEGLGFEFGNETYVLPQPPQSDLEGDVAIAPVAGPVWPMKGWAHYDALRRRLEADGLRVNVLPKRASLLEHLGDVAAHRCLVSGDSLPMHLALGTNTPCVTLFNCTSPWEIHDYGLQTKLVSPLLERYFYKRAFDHAATTAITLDEVYRSVMERLTMVAERA
jgi:hypothetical protein